MPQVHRRQPPGEATENQTIENILHVVARSGHTGVRVWRELGVLVLAQQIRKQQRQRLNRNFRNIVKELVATKRLIKIYDRCYSVEEPQEPENDPYLRDLMPLSEEDRERILQFLQRSPTGRCYRDLQNKFRGFGPEVLKKILIRLIREGYVDQDFEARFYKVIQN
ncbi:hypothetical protein AVEN_270189-1 [Araneus ventricosus]|uniref:Uncharacterized protein n=1 Tax=Araneus ventricosus TaxID=182803 RepID=A0A4Y2USU4_ARAVE|nr:hypothetical protein AVEN_270189-1 [Araneus ventricosus]